MIRNSEPRDASAINRVAIAAFEEFRDEYSDWPSLSERVSSMSTLSETGEIIVASSDEDIIGAVAYVGPNKPKSSMFDTEWPIIRSLVVVPQSRGRGIGRRLTEECILRARRDEASRIALHTSKIMKVALPLYERMGFVFHKDAPMIFGVPYGIYLKDLKCQQSVSLNSDQLRRSS